MLYDGFTIPKNDGNDVKSRFYVKVFLEDIRIGCRNKELLFLFRHGDVGISIFIGLTRLHFHDDQELPIPGDDVNLLVDIVPIALQNLIALAGQIIDCKFLT